MKDCCGVEEISNLETNVIKNLRKLLGEGKENEEAKEFILTKIKKRITLDKNITEKNFISFLKQKIGEEKKEVECCPCYDCFWKKPIGDLGGKPEEKKGVEEGA